MKQRMLRILCILMCFALLIAIPVQAEEISPRASKYIGGYGGSLHKTTGDNFEIRYSVYSGEDLDQIGVFMIQLTKSTDQVTWYREAVFYSSDYPDLMAENDFTHSGHITYTGQSGYYYRANITFYGCLDGDSERFSMYTNTIYIPYSQGGRVAE